MSARKRSVCLFSLYFCGENTNLLDNEKESIKGYSQGEALFVCGNRRMRINVILTPEELASFGSGGGL